jgi:hypothetical protein
MTITEALLNIIDTTKPTISEVRFIYDCIENIEREKHERESNA